MEGSVVYFIKGRDAIKIGFSRDVRDRMRALAAGSAENLELIGTIPGGADLERCIHKQLGAYRRHGEWFDDCDVVRDVLQNPPEVIPVVRVVRSSFTSAVMRRAKQVFHSLVAQKVSDRASCTLRTAEYWMNGSREMGLESFVTLLNSDCGAEFFEVLCDSVPETTRREWARRELKRLRKPISEIRDERIWRDQ